MEIIIGGLMIIGSGIALIFFAPPKSDDKNSN